MRIAKATDPRYLKQTALKLFKLHEKDLQLRELEANKVLIKKGVTADGVYVVLEGELAAYEPGKRDEIIRIFRKDFVFDVECVYDIPALYTIKTFRK